MTHFQLLQTLPLPKSFQELRRQVAVWQAHNFPEKRCWAPLLGVIEEQGELSHAVLKSAQGIRGDAAKHRADIIDALADITVFLADYVNQCSCTFPEEYRYELDWQDHYFEETADKPEDECPETTLHERIMDLAVAVGDLSQSHRIEGPHDCRQAAGAIMATVAGIARAENIDLTHAIGETWQKVRARDWRANKEDGGETLTPEKKQSIQRACDEAISILKN